MSTPKPPPPTFSQFPYFVCSFQFVMLQSPYISASLELTHILSTSTNIYTLLMERTCFPFPFFVALLMVQCYMASPGVANVPNITTDQSALLALKASISYDPHNVLTNNWSTGTSVCNWIGITCGFHHHRVTALNLSYMNLTGTIPPHIGNLSFLVSLSLINNSFHGSVPNELARLYRLRYLSLKSNDFSGEIPSWMGLLSKLRLLSLADNSFTGSIPPSLCNISSFEAIRFASNKLSGSFSLYMCKRLQYLYLGYNYFTGSIPSEIGNLIMLRELYLYSNNFRGMFSHVLVD
jgi:LRR receptor-like serine/threonine-protein kinase FLS2